MSQDGSAKTPAESAPPGELIWQGSPTWRSRFGFTMLAFLFDIVGLLLYAALAIHFGATSYQALASLGLFAIGSIMLAVQWAKLSAIRYRLTTKRIEWETGLLSRRIDGIDVSRVRHVEYFQSIGDRLGRVSRLHIFVQDQEDPEIVIIGLPSSRQVYDQVAQAAQIGRRGTVQIVQ
jgi:hypothetical protein